MSAPRAAFQQCLRSFRTSAIRRSGHDEPEGFPGSNLPFSIHGHRYKLLAYFIAFFGVPFALPFFVVRHHLLK
ncbi:cytochrome c oxidase subunit 7C [Osmia lignaria lignaria]|uniref:cytochrome c oxidase subunit 7C n=1 Tax=Osmia lignaria lignaria TaxID=1437193 RepID=UPI00402B5BA4